MKPFFYWWWLAALLLALFAPALVFGAIDFVGYMLYIQGIPGYPPLTFIIAKYVPSWVIIVFWIAWSAFWVYHFIDAKKYVQSTLRALIQDNPTRMRVINRLWGMTEE